jgi:C1A family cysteine protease
VENGDNGLQHLRDAISAGQAAWRAGDTALSRLPHAERLRRLGVRPGPDDPPFAELARRAQARRGLPPPVTRAAGAPAAYDLRNVGGQNFTSPIRDQGSCGSCVAFGTVAALEGTYRVQQNNPNLTVDLSEAHLFYCLGRALGITCESGWLPDAALTACRDTGVADDACYPYAAGDQDCSGRCADWETRVTKITGFQQLAARADMKAWLSTTGPLTACFVVFADFWNYTGGVYRHVTGEAEGGHAISIIGYDDGQSCWICRNSWGTGWGESGFFRIAYGECEIDTWQVCGVQGIVESAWQNNKTVRGLWAVADTRNAWAYIDGLGWRQIASDSDGVLVTLLTQLSTAKAAARPVNVFLAQGVIQQVYVL